MPSFPKTDQLSKSTSPIVSFGGQVNVLSLVYYPGDYKHTSHRAPVQQLYYKHPSMRLLDCLTLLLVTRGPHDGGAISLVRSPQKIALYYAKNEPCNQQEREYINDLLKRVVTVTEERTKNACRTDILRSVILNCGMKIKKRLTKIYYCLNNLHRMLGHYRIVNDPCIVDVEVSLRKLIPGYFFPTDETMTQFFTRIFDGIIVDMEKPVLDDSNLGTLIRLSWAIAMAPNIHLILDGVLLHRIRKLGDYESAIRMLVNEMPDLKRCGKYSVTIEEVLHPKSLDVYVSVHPTTVLNTWAKAQNAETIISQDLLSSTFPQMRSPAPNLKEPAEQRNIAASAHCECTLALYLVRKYWSSNHKRKRGLKIQLGVSKPSCFMCQLFLDALMKEDPDISIIVTSFNSKILTGWKFPEASSLAVKKMIHERISKLMVDVLKKTLHKGRAYFEGKATSAKAITLADREELMGTYWALIVACRPKWVVSTGS